MRPVLRRHMISVVSASALLLSGDTIFSANRLRVGGESADVPVRSVSAASLTKNFSRGAASWRNTRKISSAAANDQTSVPEDLFAKARLRGAVRVIVHLRFSPAPGKSQEQAIQAARRLLLGELSQVVHRVLRSYDSIPAVALEVAVDGLEVLRASSHVRQVSLYPGFRQLIS